MKKFLAISAILLGWLVHAAAQQRFVSFDSAVPANWSASGSSPLAVSSQHVKGGSNALMWNAGSGDQLKATGLAIPASETGSFSASSAQLFIYSTVASNDTLVFQFLDNAGNIKRTGRMLLNFQGWRDYHRSYRYDYNNGNELPSFLLDECRISYKPALAGTSRVVYIDEVTFVGDTENRMPGPHMVLDYQHFVPPSPVNPLASWLNSPDIPVTAASSDELNGLQQIKAAYARTIGTVSAADLASAKSYVQDCHITRNSDNSITGRPITDTDNPATLVLLSKHVGSLARAFLKNNDTEARDMLLLFTEYLLDQGVAEGGRNALATNSYSNARTFPVGFLEALSIYPSALREEVIKMLKWSHEFNKIYDSDPLPGQNTDFVYIKLTFLFELACADPSPDVAVRDLKCLKRFLEQNTDISQGARDGIKPDGTGFHHKTHHLSYMYAFGAWVDRAYTLKGTVFRISQPAYANMALAFKSIFLESSKGMIFANSESGRTPFQSKMPVNQTQFRKLVEIGGDILGAAYEPDLASVYNYIYNVNTYAVPKASLDGFHHFNYAQLGVFRKNNWTAIMKGFTDRLWGTEIYATENRYGRYQSYGALEVLYDGSLSATGYVENGEGWDWNVMPGTTTVHVPFTDLQAQKSRADEYQLSSFAGALSLGKNGIFGMDFIQDARGNYTTSNLTFRKSVFAFDSILVCLGSHISTSNSLGSVATNLFQAVNTAGNPPIYINSTTPTASDYNGTIHLSSNYVWMLNGQGTGFYIPEGNGAVSVIRGQQSTPVYTSLNGTPLKTAYVSKAWINHGTKPTSDNYQYVLVPATTAANMQSLAADFDAGSVYTVLKQTDTLHAVKYLPENLTSYVFFLPQAKVDVGYLKRISNKALVGIKESGDTLLLTINNPDLNTVPDAESTWRATQNNIAMDLSGNWTVLDNPSNAAITQQTSVLTVEFSLIHGFSASVKLLKNTTTPVRLLNFNGKYQDSGVLLNWATAQEKNTRKFRLYRGTDTIHFNPIGEVDAAGNSSSSLYYSFTDNYLPVISGSVYYKLECLDADGTLSYAVITAVKLPGTQKKLVIAPNPVLSTAEVYYSAAGRQAAVIQVYSVQGIKLLEQAVETITGNNKFLVDTSSLPSGEYVLAFTGQAITERKLFIKL